MAESGPMNLPSELFGKMTFTWAIEHGATHYTHWFQPLTGSTAEKHDAFIIPDFGTAGTSTAFSGDQSHPGRAGRFSRSPPAASVPPSRPAATPPGTRPARLHHQAPNTPRSASRPRSSPGPARRSTRRPRCCARCRRSATRRCASSRSSAPTCGVAMVITTARHRAGVLPDRPNSSIARPDLLICGRTLFGAGPQGAGARRSLLRPIPERVLAFMARSSASCSETRRAGQDPAQRGRPGQYEIAPVFETPTSRPTTRC
jgi:glutamine synthetase